MGTTPRQGARRLAIAAGATCLAGLLFGTLAQAQVQPERRGKPRVPLGPAPGPETLAGIAERGPDGVWRVKKGAMVSVAGPDGESLRNADGSLVMVSLENPTGTRPTITPGSPEAEAAGVRARANGIQPWEGATASGERPTYGPGPR